MFRKKNKFRETVLEYCKLPKGFTNEKFFSDLEKAFKTQFYYGTCPNTRTINYTALFCDTYVIPELSITEKNFIPTKHTVEIKKIVKKFHEDIKTNKERYFSMLKTFAMCLKMFPEKYKISSTPSQTLHVPSTIKPYFQNTPNTPVYFNYANAKTYFIKKLKQATKTIEYIRENHCGIYGHFINDKTLIGHLFNCRAFPIIGKITIEDLDKRIVSLCTAHSWDKVEDREKKKYNIYFILTLINV